MNDAFRDFGCVCTGGCGCGCGCRGRGCGCAADEDAVEEGCEAGGTALKLDAGCAGGGMGRVDIDAGLDVLAFGDTAAVFNLSPAMVYAWWS